MVEEKAENRKQVNRERVRQMSKVELAILIVLGLALVWMDYPLWLGLCAVVPAIFLTPEGGEEDGRSDKNLHRDKHQGV